jgi:uncharacterized protein
MNRYLTEHIIGDLPKKMIVVTGPRQAGKTTLARDLGTQFSKPLYLNYDAQADRARILRADWAPTHDYVVLDEIHSMPDWKQYLKGVFDTKPTTQALLVTGSARLDTFRQAGESLAGRYFRWRLHPFSVREFLPQVKSADDALAALLKFSGFPEPLFAGTDANRKRWQNQYFTDLVREDVLEFSRIHEVRAMRNLLALLRARTGSPLSIESLARDLAIAPNTARNYINILEALHIVFLVRPYHRNIARAQAKAPKLYFYDWAYVQNPNSTDDASGAQFENCIASHLLKHVQFLNDSQGEQLELHYIRTASGHEIDFVIANEAGDATQFIEVKLSDSKPTYALKQMAQTHANAKAIQLVLHGKHDYEVDGISVCGAAQWLAVLAA